jgi:hypothetical protein
MSYSTLEHRHRNPKSCTETSGGKWKVQPYIPFLKHSEYHSLHNDKTSAADAADNCHFYLHVNGYLEGDYEFNDLNSPFKRDSYPGPTEETARFLRKLAWRKANKPRLPVDASPDGLRLLYREMKDLREAAEYSVQKADAVLASLTKQKEETAWAQRHAHNVLAKANKLIELLKDPQEAEARLKAFQECNDAIARQVQRDEEQRKLKAEQLAPQDEHSTQPPANVHLEPVSEAELAKILPGAQGPSAEAPSAQ